MRLHDDGCALNDLEVHDFLLQLQSITIGFCGRRRSNKAAEQLLTLKGPTVCSFKTAQ